MALKHQLFPSPTPLFHTCYTNHSSPKPHLLLYPKTPKLFSIFATRPTSEASQSSDSIFSSFLDQAEDEEQQRKEEEEEEIENPKDPILRFFKSRPPSKDPDVEAKMVFKQNQRRPSWHLTTFTKSFNSPEEEEEEEGDGEDKFVKMGPPEGSESDEKAVSEVAREILQIARTLPENMTLGECLEGFEKRVSAHDALKALRLMADEKLVMSCLYFFEWMGLQEPSLLTSRACSVLFPLLGSSGKGRELMILFRNLPEKKRFRNVLVYTAALSGLLSSGRYDDAWKVYEEMETNDIQPDHVTCSIMVTLTRKCGQSAKDAWNLFKKMNRKGTCWGPEVLGALVKSFCDEGLKNEALIILTEMEKKGVTLNTIVYNTLMDAYVRSNQVEEAEGLFADMKAKGLMPNSATYNTLMNAYSKRMQPEIVENLLLEMQDMGLEPDVKSYTCLISAYGRRKDMSDMAANAFLRMKKVGIKPTSHSYTALIHAFSISRWHEKAYIAFENMRKEGIEPTIETYTALLDAFRRAGDTQTLMKIWKLMLSEKIEGTRVTFNTLVDGFAKQGQYLEARDAIFEFGKMGFEPTVMTYNMLMNAYARGGQESKLPQLLKEMAVLNLKPDSCTYSTMIYAYIRARDFKRAFFYHKQMVKSGQVPDAKSYAKLRALLDMKAASKNKKDRNSMLGNIKRQMGLLKPEKKTKKDEFWKTKKRYVRTPDSAPKKKR